MRYRWPTLKRLSQAVKQDGQLRAMLLGPALGLVYFGFTLTTGLAIGCPFRGLTGLLCPGCGVTTMCVRLVRLDIPGAFKSNPLLFCLLPFAAFAYFSGLWRQFRGAPPRFTRIRQGLLRLLCAGLLVFGVIRSCT